MPMRIKIEKGFIRSLESENAPAFLIRNFFSGSSLKKLLHRKGKLSKAVDYR
jgi:hypothetical protein